MHVDLALPLCWPCSLTLLTGLVYWPDSMTLSFQVLSRDVYYHWHLCWPGLAWTNLKTPVEKGLSKLFCFTRPLLAFLLLLNMPIDLSSFNLVSIWSCPTSFWVLVVLTWHRWTSDARCRILCLTAGPSRQVPTHLCSPSWQLQTSQRCCSWSRVPSSTWTATHARVCACLSWPSDCSQTWSITSGTNGTRKSTLPTTPPTERRESCMLF